MNDNGNIPNPQLHSFVTGHSFVLTLAASHIKWLHRVATNYRNGFPRTERCDQAVGLQGLIRRGLVEHRANFGFEPKHKRNWKCATLNSCFRLTRAGWITLDLLAEAGMVDAVDKRSPKRRLVA
jgi:hypothetical protein